MTVPRRCSTTERRSASWSASAPAIAVARSSQSRVLPSMSVIRNDDRAPAGPGDEPGATAPMAGSGVDEAGGDGRGGSIIAPRTSGAMPVDEPGDAGERLLEALVR